MEAATEEPLQNSNFGGTFPFKSQYLQQDKVRLVRIDEGVGQPVVLVHGNPTCLYLYRAFIHPLVRAG